MTERQYNFQRKVLEARQIVTGSACPLDQVSLVEASTFTEEMGLRSFRFREEKREREASIRYTRRRCATTEPSFISVIWHFLGVFIIYVRFIISYFSAALDIATGDRL